MNNEVVIYVDGSYSHSQRRYSYGLVALVDNKVIYKDCEPGNNPEAVPLRNVSGEVLGAMKAVEFALENGYKNLTIIYDYQGIESWALGKWKRNNVITKSYHEYMQNNMTKINIQFKKVKGHSGEEYNEMADSLAKEALGI